MVTSSTWRNGATSNARRTTLVADGILLLAFSLGGGSYWRIRPQTTRPVANTNRPPASKSVAASETVQINFTDWSPLRIEAYHQSLAGNFLEPMATVSVPRLRLRAPLFEGVDDRTLDRGVGHVPKTSFPGEDGNLVIAGHRDGFFRGLKDIHQGDVIEIESFDERDTYVVERTTVVDPGDVDVLKSRSRPTLTLVTCYPFYFIGHAPQRFIVEAYRTRRLPLPQPKLTRSGRP